MRRIRGQTGMSLVEATIILLVLMLLTSVLAPSIFDYFRDAQSVKVKEDCEAIGVSVARLVRDVGHCLKMAPGPCTMQNRADILFSDGPNVVGANLAGNAVFPFNPGTIVTQNWDWPTNRSPMTAQFTTNLVAGIGPMNIYDVPAPAAFLWTAPVFRLGWRGAYLASPIGPDPWGMQYLVNSGYLAPAFPLFQQPVNNPEPEGTHGWNRDVFCLSAGPNMFYETFIGGSLAGLGQGTERGGDDFTYVIQGSSR